MFDLAFPIYGNMANYAEMHALAYHGLTTQVRHLVDIALPSHAQIPKIDRIPLRVFWYSEPCFSAGMAPFKVDGVEVRIYSPEKTIADCVKYRKKIRTDLAIEALRTYRERTRKPDVQTLCATYDCLAVTPLPAHNGH